MFDLVYPSEPAPLYPRPSIDQPGVQLFPKGEVLPLIEPNGLVYGQASRSWCHGGSHALHPVVHLQIIDRMGMLYLQKRSVHKHRYPGCWDTAVGGHVSYGEQVEEALYREAAEELGLSAFNPIFLRTYTYHSRRDTEFVIVYAMIGHPDLAPDNAEVSEGRWWSFPEIDAQRGSGLLTPNLEEELRQVGPSLLALL